MHPKISIVIVTYNDKEKLVDCLLSLKKQTYPAEKREIIVVDDGSTDGSTEAINSSFPEAKVIKKKNSGPDNSRNYGIREAKGKIIAFIDSDCTALPNWLDNIACRLRENHISIVGGQILHRGSFWTRLIGISDFGEFQSQVEKEVSNIPTCNMSVKRNIFEQHNFDPCLRAGGDVVFCHQLKKNGYKLLYDPEIKVIHQPQVDFLAFFKRAYCYGEVFVNIRRIEPKLHYAEFTKFGLPGIMSATLGRTFLDWYRLFCYRKEMKFKVYEILPAMFVLFFKRLLSLWGAVKSYRSITLMEDS